VPPRDEGVPVQLRLAPAVCRRPGPGAQSRSRRGRARLRG